VCLVVDYSNAPLYFRRTSIRLLFQDNHCHREVTGAADTESLSCVIPRFTRQFRDRIAAFQSQNIMKILSQVKNKEEKLKYGCKPEKQEVIIRLQTNLKRSSNKSQRTRISEL